MKRVHQITGLVFLALALGLGWNALQLPYYSRLGPGPGFFPFWLCIILGGLAAGVLVQTTLAGSPRLPDDFRPERAGLIRIAVVIGGLVFVAATMRTLGYQLAMFVFYLVLLPTLGFRQPLPVIAAAALGSFGTYFIFARYLSQPLPVGIFGL